MPGVTALFAGQPGTGKSMAAEVIANDLGLDVCKIDLAQVISKYIGETEKNLAKIFDESERCGVVLVFDEADALFGKRSDVKDSHDRYANVETSYLLQRMERYRGLAILTTNLRANLDEAFIRRIGVSIDFPLPGAADRLRLWQRALAEAPCEPDLVLAEVSERLELAGGSIVSAALAAAYLAAEAGCPVSSELLIRAVRWEQQKAGRLMGSDSLDALLPSSDRVGR
jgi:SpoVK/Ycf46/Vps4 family AAA+-type ATPase